VSSLLRKTMNSMLREVKANEGINFLENVHFFIVYDPHHKFWPMWSERKWQGEKQMLVKNWCIIFQWCCKVKKSFISHILITSRDPSLPPSFFLLSGNNPHVGQHMFKFLLLIQNVKHGGETEKWLRKRPTSIPWLVTLTHIHL